MTNTMSPATNQDQLAALLRQPSVILIVFDNASASSAQLAWYSTTTRSMAASDATARGRVWWVRTGGARTVGRAAPRHVVVEGRVRGPLREAACLLRETCVVRAHLLIGGQKAPPQIPMAVIRREVYDVRL